MHYKSDESLWALACNHGRLRMEGKFAVHAGAWSEKSLEHWKAEPRHAQNKQTFNLQNSWTFFLSRNRPRHDRSRFTWLLAAFNFLLPLSANTRGAPTQGSPREQAPQRPFKRPNVCKRVYAGYYYANENSPNGAIVSRYITTHTNKIWTGNLGNVIGPLTWAMALDR